MDNPLLYQGCPTGWSRMENYTRIYPQIPGLILPVHPCTEPILPMISELQMHSSSHFLFRSFPSLLLNSHIVKSFFWDMHQVHTEGALRIEGFCMEVRQAQVHHSCPCRLFLILQLSLPIKEKELAAWPSCWLQNDTLTTEVTDGMVGFQWVSYCSVFH